MNPDVRVLIADAERAVDAEKWSAARDSYVDAGDVAAGYGLWRAAMRCYRHALELDVTDVEVVTKAIAISTHSAYATSLDWAAYRAALREVRFPRFGCRAAETIAGDRGCYVSCPLVGPVLALAMPAPAVVEATPFKRFARVPLAMALIVLRRALYARPRAEGDDVRVRVTFGSHAPIELDEAGEWWPAR